MSTLRFTLLSDGSSDRSLLRAIDWLLQECVSSNVAIQPGSWAELRNLRNVPTDLHERMERAIDLYPCDMLIVHRDAENQPIEKRVEEITEAIKRLVPSPLVVPLIPIRMQEAWLLFNQAAIREAAGNPNGTMPLDLPTMSEVERRANPKEILHQAIRVASGATGRKLKKLHLPSATFRVAEMIDDFSPLRQLSAFQRFESDLVEALDSLQFTK